MGRAGKRQTETENNRPNRPKITFFMNINFFSPKVLKLDLIWDFRPVISGKTLSDIEKYKFANEIVIFQSDMIPPSSSSSSPSRERSSKRACTSTK